jgi:hypothetical protein
MPVPNPIATDWISIVIYLLRARSGQGNRNNIVVKLMTEYNIVFYRELGDEKINY